MKFLVQEPNPVMIFFPCRQGSAMDVAMLPSRGPAWELQLRRPEPPAPSFSVTNLSWTPGDALPERKYSETFAR